MKSSDLLDEVIHDIHYEDTLNRWIEMICASVYRKLSDDEQDYLAWCESFIEEYIKNTVKNTVDFDGNS